MNEKLEKLLLVLLAIGISFLFYIDINLVNNQIIQYMIILPIFLVYFIFFFIIEKKKMNLYLIAQILLFILLFFFASDKFGIKKSDYISLFGFLIIPIMIILFQQLEKKNALLNYFIYVFTITEIILIIVKLNSTDILGLSDINAMRKTFPRWPNYFAVISSVKVGITFYLMRIKKITSREFYLSIIISAIVIFLSLSRTSIIMLIVIIMINMLVLLEKQSIKNIIKNNLKQIIIVSFVLIIVSISFIAKGNSIHNGLLSSIEGRLRIWKDLIPFIKDNWLIGIGFRSTYDTVTLVDGRGSTHNDFIDIFIKSGIIGFLTIYSYFFRRTFILFKKGRIELASIIISIFIAGLFQNPLKDITIMVIFSLLISCSYNRFNKIY